MGARVLTVLALLGPLPAAACSPCRAYVQAGIFDGSFAVKLLVITAPVVLLVLAAALLYYSARTKR